MEDIIKTVKCFEDPRMLIEGFDKVIEKKTKNKRVDFLVQCYIF